MQRRIRLRKKRHLVLKTEGLEFLEKWFETRKRIPPNLTKLYQLLLHLVTMKGTVPIYLAVKWGYPSKLIKEAVSRGYVKLTNAPKKPSEQVLKRIRGIIGKPPQEMSV